MILPRTAQIVIAAGVFCASLSFSFAQEAVNDVEARDQDTWREAIARTDVPAEGCFEAFYPSLTWTKTECTVTPSIPYPRLRGATVGGNNDDYFAEVTTGLVNRTVGSFPTVTGVKTEKGPLGANDYMLQVNSNFMQTPACDGASNPANCSTWEQFIYSSGYKLVYIQYWLINYNNPCPAGWTSSGNNCYRNSVNTKTVPQAAITQLKTLKLSGSAKNGGVDTLVFTLGTTAYSFTEPDSVVDLATAWTASEFNIFGDGNGSAATFNPLSSLTVKVAVSNGTEDQPTCVKQGSTTGETSNLSLGTCTPTGGAAPYIEFSEWVITPITKGKANHESPSLNDGGAFVWSQQVPGTCSGGQCWQVFEKLPGGQPEQITSSANDHTHPAIDDNGDILYLKDGEGAGPGLEVVDLVSGVENQIEFSSGNPPGCTEPPAGPPTCTAWRAAGQFFGIGDTNAQIISYQDFCSPTCTRTFDVSGVGTFSALPAGTASLDVNSNGDVAYDDGTGTIFEISLTTQTPTKVAPGTLPRINDQGDVVLIAGGQVQVWFHPDYVQHTTVNSSTTAIWADINNAGVVAFEDVDSSQYHQVYEAAPVAPPK
jgi:hypothetical protein